MQSFYPEQFEREMGCTEAEWLMWLPRAIGSHPWQHAAQGVRVQIAEGRLHIHWQVMAARALGSFHLPRLHVHFEFEAVDEGTRFTFMKRFDLYTQRGGG